MPKRRVFYSFHYNDDSWRASQVRNMGIVEGDPPVNDNDWETIKRGGNAAIERWIDGQLNGKSCVIVLIGSATADRKWINYEIEQGWNRQKGVLGIHIHDLQDQYSRTAAKGLNPFRTFTFGRDRRPLSGVVETYDPPFVNSKLVYEYINTNLEEWVEHAIRVRERIGN